MTYAASAHSVFDHTLSMLDGLLAKAADDQRGDALLAAKLADDMLPLATQVRFAGHQVTNTLNRLADGEYPAAENDPETLAQARAHITELRGLIAAHAPESWLKSGVRVEFSAGSDFNFASEAHEYVRDWAMPNFYFHVITAYAILRREGLAIGKADFMPHMMRYFVPPAQ